MLRSALETLKSYQEVILRIGELDRMLASVPPEVTQLETEWKQAHDRLADFKKRRETLSTELKKKETQLEEANAKATKFEKDLHEVTNNREYHAVLKEIDTAKKLVHSLSDEIANKKKEIGELENQIFEGTSIESTAREKHEAALADHKESMGENQREREEKSKTRELLFSSIPTRTMREFERIAERRQGIGIAYCVSSVCQGCNVRIRQQIVDQLRRSDKIIHCENCKRILYFAESN